eukprot:2513763-Rhodomonas_salina.1
MSGTDLRYAVLRICYAVSSTDLRYALSGTDLRYAFAMRCPVLTYAMLLSGSLSAYPPSPPAKGDSDCVAQVSISLRAPTRCPVLTCESPYALLRDVRY